MSKRVKIWLIVATSLILVGCVLFLGVMTMMKWNFKALTTVQYQTNTYAVTDAFTHISVSTITADVTFAVSKDDTVSVACYEDVNVKHAVSVEEDTLVIKGVDTRKWYQHLNIFSASPKVTVYLPQDTYGNLMVDVTTGDISVPKGYAFATVNIQSTTGDIAYSADVVGDITLKVTTGDVKVSSVTCGDMTIGNTTGDANLTDVACRNLTSTGTTGDMELRDVIATGNFFIKRGTGDVSFVACDAAELTVKTTTGDISGSLLTAKVFDAHATTGHVDVPLSTTGGTCQLSATTGDIKITIR